MIITERAEDKFLNGLNCAQSVFSTIAPDLGINEQLAIDLSRAFGAGISYRAEICGAVSAALMAIGLKIGQLSINEEVKKELTRKYTSEFIENFKTINKSVICKEILGKDLSIPKELELLNTENAFDKICPNMVKTSMKILIDIFKLIEKENV